MSLTPLFEQNSTILSSVDAWSDSPFKDVAIAKSDPTGKWGEKMVHDILVAAGLDSHWDGDSNTEPEDGVYDIKANGKRIEVKTATASYNKDRDALVGFQHENIYLHKCWDYVVFVDVQPRGIHFSCISYEWLDPEQAERRKHPILNKKITMREGSFATKLDFSPRTLRILEEQGLSVYYDIDIDNSSDVVNLFKRLLDT